MLHRSRKFDHGWISHTIVAATILIAVLLALSLISPHHGSAFRLAAAGAMLLLSILIWPFLHRLQSKISKAIDFHVKRRSLVSEYHAFKGRRWLELAEEIAHVGHWRYSLLDQSLVWSDEIYRIHGLPKAAGPPDLQTAIDAYHPDDRDIVNENFARAIEQKSSFDIAVRLIRADGALRHVASRGVTQTDSNGNVVSIFGVFMDVTELKMIEAELRGANQRAELANTKLQLLAMVDALTGLTNRRQFDLTFVEEAKRASRNETSLALVMIDIDHFKPYNDIYGHPAGDDCLRQVAQVIQSVPQRPGDLVARYGGEEFVVLLPNTDETGAAAVAETIRTEIIDHALIHRGSPTGRITITCGVAALHPARNHFDPNELLKFADQALYQAKNDGRNRVCRSTAKLWTAPV